MSKVLVIEDNIEISENIVEILELADYDVIVAKKCKQGVEMATMNLPDIILSDIMMPDLDGYGVLYLLNKIQKPQLFRLFSLLQNQNELICVKEWKWVPMII
jgi:CheY-like chemotaxis protein